MARPLRNLSGSYLPKYDHDLKSASNPEVSGSVASPESASISKRPESGSEFIQTPTDMFITRCSNHELMHAEAWLIELSRRGLEEQRVIKFEPLALHAVAAARTDSTCTLGCVWLWVRFPDVTWTVFNLS